MFLSWHEEQDVTNGWKSAGISGAVTINVTSLPSRWQSCVYSSFNQPCDQICNASQFASVPEGKVRLHDDDEDFIGDSFVLFHGDKEGISWRYSR